MARFKQGTIGKVSYKRVTYLWFFHGIIDHSFKLSRSFSNRDRYEVCYNKVGGREYLKIQRDSKTITYTFINLLE